MSGETLLVLAERCEKASGPDRDIDRAIAMTALGWRVEVDTTVYVSGEPVDYWYDPAGYCQGYQPPSFTASLDAAMTLMPEADWEPYGGAVSPYNVVITTAYNSVGVYPTDGNSTGMHDKRGGRSQALSVPLALCAAALRARAHQETSNDG